MIRGRVTPAKRESVGLERDGSRGEQSNDSLRSRHDYAPAVYPSDFLEGIKQREIAAGDQLTHYPGKEKLQKRRKNGRVEIDLEQETGGRAGGPEPTDATMQLVEGTPMTP